MARFFRGLLQPTGHHIGRAEGHPLRTPQQIANPFTRSTSSRRCAVIEWYEPVGMQGGNSIAAHS
jgi:hypothetical protein